jgi:hypothetical protein
MTYELPSRLEHPVRGSLWAKHATLVYKHVNLITDSQHEFHWSMQDTHSPQYIWPYEVINPVLCSGYDSRRHDMDTCLLFLHAVFKIWTISCENCYLWPRPNHYNSGLFNPLKHEGERTWKNWVQYQTEGWRISFVHFSITSVNQCRCRT